MPAMAIEARGLCKAFGDEAALDGLDLAVPEGSVYGLIGRNGAGKTTAIKLLLGLLHADEGNALVLGLDMWSATPLERSRVAAVLQDWQAYDWMSGNELCVHSAAFYPRWDDRYAFRLVDGFELTTAMERPVGRLSGGQRRRLAVVLALAARPDVLILDEPAANLDPIARRGLLDALVDVLAAEPSPTVLYSTHLISDLERLADHVGIMHAGSMLAAGPLDALSASVRRVQLVFDHVPQPDLSLPGALIMEVTGLVATAVVLGVSDAGLKALADRMGARLDVFPLGLEDVFVELVASAERRAAPKAQGRLVGARDERRPEGFR